MCCHCTDVISDVIKTWLVHSHRHMWHLFSWYVWTANIGGFPPSIKKTFLCVFFQSFGMTATSFAAQRDIATNESIDHRAPDLCVLSASSDLHIIRWQLLQLWGFQRRSVCVSPHWWGFLSLWVYRSCGRAADTHATEHSHTLLHTLFAAFSPRLATQNWPHDTSSQRWGYKPVKKKWLTGVSTVIHMDPEITKNHQRGVTGERCPQALNLPPAVDGKYPCASGKMHMIDSHTDQSQ